MQAKTAIKNFLFSYLDLPVDKPKIVCIGGGTGMPTLLSGLKSYTQRLTAVVTMADEGGSTGRLRRTMGVPAVGDIRKCFAALAQEEEIMTKLLAYRFRGERYASDNQSDDALGGHSFGNLFLSALTEICGGFEPALDEASRILKVKGRIMPSTDADVHIWAETDTGEKVYGEENIDLGKYNGKRTIQLLHLDPPDARGYKPAIDAILSADVVIGGPGDLFTSIMPNLLIADIRDAILQTRARKIFIVNTTNKPFETPRYKLTDYIKAIEKHTGHTLFDIYLTNKNQAPTIPKNLKYNYVTNDRTAAEAVGVIVAEADVVDESFALHHDAKKLALAVMELVK